MPAGGGLDVGLHRVDVLLDAVGDGLAFQSTRTSSVWWAAKTPCLPVGLFPAGEIEVVHDLEVVLNGIVCHVPAHLLETARILR